MKADAVRACVGRRWSGEVAACGRSFGMDEAERADGPAAVDDEAKSCLPAAFQAPQTAKRCSHPCHNSWVWLAQARGEALEKQAGILFWQAASRSSSHNRPPATKHHNHFSLSSFAHSSPYLPTRFAYSAYCFPQRLSKYHSQRSCGEDSSVAHLQIHAQNLRRDSFAWIRRDGQTALDKMEEGATLEVIQTEVSLSTCTALLNSPPIMA